jgi:hypothetical protein
MQSLLVFQEAINAADIHKIVEVGPSAAATPRKATGGIPEPIVGGGCRSNDRASNESRGGVEQPATESRRAGAERRSGFAALRFGRWCLGRRLCVETAQPQFVAGKLKQSLLFCMGQ